jgi:hypothetical protein
MLTEILLRLPFSVIGQCSLVPTSYWLEGKCAKNLPQAASGMILQNHRRLPVSIFIVKIAALGSLKRVTGRIFIFEKVISKEQAKTLSLIFSSTKKQKIVKSINSRTEST